MYQYLSSVGLDAYANKKMVSKIIDMVILEPSERYLSNFGEDTIKIEIVKFFGDSFGVLILGELDDEEEYNIDSIIPYKKGKYLLDISEVDIEKISEDDIYQCSCEDDNTAIPIEFYLQNVVDYLDIEKSKQVFIEGVRLIGFCKDGSIILPIVKDEIEIQMEEEEEKIRSELIKAAKNGDEEALEILAMEEEETSQMIEERLENEDLLTIIDGYFMSVGNRNYEYAVLGTISEITEIKNSLTDESVYIFDIKCLGLKFEVLINKNKIIGEPKVGRRFKGVIWLQGHVEFI